MPDLFDEIEAPSKDIFDDVSGDVFDQIDLGDVDETGIPKGLPPRERKRIELGSELAAEQAAQDQRDKQSRLVAPLQDLAEGALTGLSLSPSRIAAQFERGIPAVPAAIKGEQSFTPLPPVVSGSLNPGENRAIKIPEIPTTKETPVAGQVAAGLGNAVIEFANIFTTPEGILSLGIGGLPKESQKAVIGTMAANMAAHYPQEFGEAIDAAKAGDWNTATKKIITTPVMSSVMGRASVEMPKIPNVPDFPGLPDPDLVSRNLQSPGTLRPQELKRFNLPDIQVPPEMFEAGNIAFDRMQRFGGQQLPPVQILPKMGRIENVPILEEPRPIEQRETRGKVSYGAEAPVLLRNAVEQAESVGLTKSAEAAKQVAKGKETDALQKQDAATGVLRPEEPEVGLPQVGEGNPVVQVAPEVLEAPQEVATTTSLPAAAEISKRPVADIETDLATARAESDALKAIKPPEPTAPMAEKVNYLNTTAKAKVAAAVKVQALEEGLKLAKEKPSTSVSATDKIGSFIDQLETGDIITSGGEKYFVIKRSNGADLFAASDGTHRFIDKDGTWASEDVEGFDSKLSPEQFFSDALPNPIIKKTNRKLTDKEGDALVGQWSNRLDSDASTVSKSATVPNTETKSLAADKNIGRTWNSPYGKQRVVSVEKGKPEFGVEDLYDVETEGTGDIRRYRGSQLEDVIEKDEHKLTPEYEKEQQEAKELAALREERAARAREKEQKQDSEIAEFTKGQSPMAAAKTKAALLKQIVANGVATSRKALIDSEVAKGAKVVSENGKRRLQKPNESFWDESTITKAAMDYAEHLINKKETAPKPKTLKQLGESLPDAGESGAIHLPIDEIAARIRKVRDFLTIDPIPRLTRAMGGDIGTGIDSAIQHASARIAVPRMVDDFLAKVFPTQYGDPAAMRKTVEIINKDNILGGYDAFIQRAVDAQNAGHGSAAAHWRQMARDVAAAHDLPGYEHDVRAAQADKSISDNIKRWNAVVNPALDKLYNEMKGMDANTPREGRGRVFGARVNLLPKSEEGRWIDALGDEAKPLPSPSSSNYRNPNAKKDKFDRRAKFTGEYSDNPAAVLANVLSHRYNEVTKIRFLNDLVRSGAGSWEKPASGLIHGQEAKALPVKMPETKTEMVGGIPVDSATKQVEKTIWVPQDVVSDVRGILDTDLRLQQNPVAKALTGLQLAQLADALTHTKNLHSVIANAQGTKAMWTDVARKMPGLSTADTAVRLGKVLYDIAQDTPAIRAEMAEMAKNGMLRQHFPATGLQKVTKMQDMIHHVDTAARVVMNRFYDNLVARGMAVDTMPARRQFVQQVGEYNKRLMSPMMQVMSRSGMSPFIVAGRNFNRFGRRLLTGNPGFEATSTKTALQARLVNFVTLGTIFTLPMMLNQVLTGSIWGRKGTPLGAVDMGTKEDEKGAHKVLDLAALYGVRRGMRATGVESVVEGLQNGRKPDEIVGGAINNVVSTAAHPWMGPALGAAYSTVTGQRLDLRGGPTPVEARKVGDRNSAKQIGENARVALKNQNPLLYSPFRPLFGDTEESFGKDMASDFLKAPGSSVGIRDVKSPALQKAGELMGAHQQTPEQQEKSTAKRQSVKAMHEGDKDKAKQFRREGVLSFRDVQDVKDRENNPLLFMVKKLGSEDAVKVWELATPEERKKITSEINQKILNSTVLDLKEKRALRERIGTLKPISP